MLTWTGEHRHRCPACAATRCCAARRCSATTSALTYTDTTRPGRGLLQLLRQGRGLGRQPVGGRRQDRRLRQPGRPPPRPASTRPASQRTKPTMSWTASTDTGGAGIDHYDVWRVGSPTSWPAVRPRRASPTPRISTEAAYTYYVVAVDKAGNSGPPTAVKSITYDVTPPTVPAGLAASASPTGAKPALRVLRGDRHRRQRRRQLPPVPRRHARSRRRRRRPPATRPSPSTAPTATACRPSTRPATSRRCRAAVTVVYDKTARARADRPHGRGDADERQAGADVDLGRSRRAVGLRPLRHLPRRGARRQLGDTRRSPTPRCRPRAPTATP